MNNDFKKFWKDNNSENWKCVWKQYESQDSVRKNSNLEREMDEFNRNKVLLWTVEQFNTFMEKYFHWKYTASNRYATTIKIYQEMSGFEKELCLMYMKDFVKALDSKQDFENKEEYILAGFRFADLIPGLGTAGQSGLLSILFPEKFGTVDQKVVTALERCGVNTGIPERRKESLLVKDGILLEKIMINKAIELNKKSSSDFWTPRKVDKVLWVMGGKDYKLQS